MTLREMRSVGLLEALDYVVLLAEVRSERATCNRPKRRLNTTLEVRLPPRRAVPHKRIWLIKRVEAAGMEAAQDFNRMLRLASRPSLGAIAQPRTQ
jgi:hypothetical protein